MVENVLNRPGEIGLTLSFFPRLIKFFIRNENFVVVPYSPGPNFQIHIAGQHVNIFSNAIIDFTRCKTKSVLVTLDIFLNVYSAIYNVFKYIQ